MDMSLSPEQKTELFYIQRRITALQNYLKLSAEEIHFSKETLHTNIQLNHSYMNKLEKIIEILSVQHQLFKQRDDAIDYIRQSLVLNSGSKQQLVHSLLTTKQTTTDLISLVLQMRNLLKRPCNLNLQINPNQSAFGSFLKENWLQFEEISKLYLILNIYNNLNFEQIQNQLLLDNNINVLIKNNTNITPYFLFEQNIHAFNEFWRSVQAKYYKLNKQHYEIQQYSVKQIQYLIQQETSDIQKYKNNTELAKMYGQRLCVVPIRSHRDGFDSYPVNKVYKSQQFKQRSKSQSNTRSQVVNSQLAMSHGSQGTTLNSLINSQQLSASQRLNQLQRSQQQQLDEIEQMEREIDQFQIENDITYKIQQLQIQLDISSVEQQYAQYVCNNDKSTELNYCSKLQQVAQQINAINQLNQQRDQLQQQINQFIEQQKGSKSQLIKIFCDLKQNTIILFQNYFKFQHIIGYFVNIQYQIDFVYIKLINDFSTQLLDLVSKITKQEMDVSQFNDIGIKTQFIFNVNDNFTYFWYQLDKQYQKITNQAVIFNYDGISPIQCNNLVKQEYLCISKTILLNDKCQLDGLHICRVPIVQEFKIDCFKADQMQQFEGLQMIVNPKDIMQQIQQTQVINNIGAQNQNTIVICQVFNKFKVNKAQQIQKFSVPRMPTQQSQKQLFQTVRINQINDEQKFQVFCNEKTNQLNIETNHVEVNNDFSKFTTPTQQVIAQCSLLSELDKQKINKTDDILKFIVPFQNSLNFVVQREFDSIKVEYSHNNDKFSVCKQLIQQLQISKQQIIKIDDQNLITKFTCVNEQINDTQQNMLKEEQNIQQFDKQLIQQKEDSLINQKFQPSMETIHLEQQQTTQRFDTQQTHRQNEYDNEQKFNLSKPNIQQQKTQQFNKVKYNITDQLINEQKFQIYQQLQNQQNMNNFQKKLSVQSNQIINEQKFSVYTDQQLVFKQHFSKRQLLKLDVTINDQKFEVNNKWDSE